MAKRDNAAQSNAIAKKALEVSLANPSISDFRKEARIYKTAVATGTARIEDTGDICAALMSDFAEGRLTAAEVAVYLAILDRPITVDEHSIRREEMALKIELRKKASEMLEERKNVLGSAPASRVV